MKVTCSNQSILDKMDTLGEKHDIQLTDARDRITKENSEIKNIRNKIDATQSAKHLPG